MTSLGFRDRLGRRAQRASIALTTEATEALEVYFRLLSKWNAKINLTALPLSQPTDETFDRLLIEPLAAARKVQDRPDRWVDLGTGGGSPAIPLKIVRPALRLTMVESKARKAAFLQEAIRALRLAGASVSDMRFEEFAHRPDAEGSADLITVRAVRVDKVLFDAAARLLAPNGRLLMFCPKASAIAALGFSHIETIALTESPAHLVILERMFHVEQRH